MRLFFVGWCLTSLSYSIVFISFYYNSKRKRRRERGSVSTRRVASLFCGAKQTLLHTPATALRYCAIQYYINRFFYPTRDVLSISVVQSDVHFH